MPLFLSPSAISTKRKPSKANSQKEASSGSAEVAPSGVMGVGDLDDLDDDNSAVASSEALSQKEIIANAFALGDDVEVGLCFCFSNLVFFFLCALPPSLSCTHSSSLCVCVCVCVVRLRRCSDGRRKRLLRKSLQRTMVFCLDGCVSLFCDCAKLRENVAWPLKHVICVQGSWGGLGVTRRRPKKDRLEQQRQKAAQMRKDAALDHVIINERSDAKVTTHHSQILSFFFFFLFEYSN